MLYLFIFFILLFFSLIEISFLNKRSEQFLIIISGLILILVAGLRYETGGDWDIYTSGFQHTNHFFNLFKGEPLYLNEKVSFEYGYGIFSSIIKQVGGNIQTIYFIIVTFNVLLLIKTLKQYTKLIIVGLFVYYCILYFHLEMIYTRQSVAVMICFWCLKFIQQKKIYRYLFFVLLASSFHRMALILIPLYFILDRNYRAFYLTIIIVVGSTLLFFHVQWIKNIIFYFANMLGESFILRAQYYTSEDIFSVSRGISIGFYLNIILFAILLFFRKKISKFEFGNIQFNYFIASLFVYFYLYEFVEISNRFRLFFLISLVVLFPYIIESFGKISNRIACFLAISIYSFMFNYKIFLNFPSSCAYNPYQNYIVYKTLNKRSTGKERLEKSHGFFNEDRKNMKR